MRFSELIPAIQMAVGPVILISGVGLLLLSMTNRFGRVIDRARLLAEANRKAEAEQKSRFESQLKMLSRRANLLRTAITLAIFSVLLAASLVITLFLCALVQSDWSAPVAVLFLGCMLLLIASLIVFIMDLNLSLEAMKLEIEQR